MITKEMIGRKFPPITVASIDANVAPSYIIEWLNDRIDINEMCRQCVKEFNSYPKDTSWGYEPHYLLWHFLGNRGIVWGRWQNAHAFCKIILQRGKQS